MKLVTRLPRSADVKNECSYTPAPIYASMTKTRKLFGCLNFLIRRWLTFGEMRQSSLLFRILEVPISNLGPQLSFPKESLFIFFLFCTRTNGNRGHSVVKVLCYKSEGRWFDPSWSHWKFSLGSTQPLPEMSTRNISWG